MPIKRRLSVILYLATMFFTMLAQGGESPSDAVAEYCQQTFAGEDAARLLSQRSQRLLREYMQEWFGDDPDYFETRKTIASEQGRIESRYTSFKILGEHIDGNKATVSVRFTSKNPVRCYLEQNRAEIAILNEYNRRTGNEAAIELNNESVRSNEDFYESLPTEIFEQLNRPLTIETEFQLVRDNGWKISFDPDEYFARALKVAQAVFERFMSIGE